MGSTAFTIAYSDNFYYTGEHLNGVPHGEGQISYKSDTNVQSKNVIGQKQSIFIQSFEGFFQNGNILRCKLATANNFIYEGELTQKLQVSSNVKGVLIDKTNVKYTGNFDKGRLCKGTIDSSKNTDQQNCYTCYTNGQYKGTSILDGKGYFYNLSQNYLAIGQFKKGNLQNGIYIFQNGNFYQGNFAQGYPNQKGVYSNISNIKQIYENQTFKQVQKQVQQQCKAHVQSLWKKIKAQKSQNNTNLNFIYKGGFKNKIFHGKSCVQFQNGDIYKGKFKGGKFHGKGQYTFLKTRTIFKGNFYYGVPSGDFIIEYSQNSLINIGQNKQNILQRYEGQIYNGLFNGMGVLHYRNGIIFKGGFTNGAKNGPGVLIFCTKRYKCLYMMNKLLGELQIISDQID